MTSGPEGERLLAVGVDGARGGWVAAACWATGAVRRSTVHFFRTIREMAAWRGGAEAPVAVDIPIGLPEVVRFRGCDTQARGRLSGSRKGSVFQPPARFLLEEAAAPVNGKPPGAREVFARVQRLVREREESGPGAEKLRGMSQQGAAIVLKIAEVDAFLREDPARQVWLFEVHPEICFLAMKGDEPAAKTTARGQLERLDLVAHEFPDAHDRIRAWPEADRHSLLDVCDAYAACWTAVRWARTGGGHPARRHDVAPPLEVLGEQHPGRAEREDATGLSMRIVV